VVDLDPTLDEAELFVIGAIVSSGGLALDDISIVGSEFGSVQRGDLFDRIATMRLDGKHISKITVADGGSPDDAILVLSASDFPALTSDVVAHAAIIQEHALRRRLAQLGTQFTAIPKGMQHHEIADRARAAIDAAVGQQSSQLTYVRDVMPDVVSQLRERASFTPTNLPDLDRIIGGFRPGALYTLAARPAVGKTAVAMQFALRMAGFGQVAFCSLEMGADELIKRMLSSELRISAHKVQRNELTDLDWKILADRRGELDAINVAIDDRMSMTLADVRQFVRSVSRRGPLAAVVLDYVQLVSSLHPDQPRRLQIGEMTRGLKGIAKEFHVPVIMLSQLNRALESRPDARPKMHDLRESGDIEQDSDVVMLLSREANAMGGSKMTIDIAKNRHGIADECHFEWEGQFSRIRPM
jgi:replicative DNA helicase